MKKIPTVASAALFVAAAILIQAFAFVFLTREGLGAVYTAKVRLDAETVEPDYMFGEYYDLKEEYEGCDLFFLGADVTVADSYTVILDLLRFANRNFAVRTLGLNVGKSTASHVNDCLATADDAALEEQILILRGAGRFTEEFISFVRSLCIFNRTMPHGGGIKVISVVTDTPARTTLDKLRSDVISLWNSAPQAVRDSLSFNSLDLFFEHFYENSDAFREFLGDKEFERFKVVDEHRRAGDYSEWKVASQLEGIVSEPALIVVDRGVVGEKSALRRYAKDMGAKAAYLCVNYVSCKGLEKGEEVEITTPMLPTDLEHGVYIVTKNKIGAFLDAFRFIADPTGGGEGSPVLTPTKDFFIVVGSGAVIYREINQ